MRLFKNLNQNETDMLLKFPAYISLLAANGDGKMDEAEEKEAIKFTTIKTFSSDPLLANYYLEVEKVFSSTIEELDKQLPKEKAARTEAINKELKKLEPILNKLGEDYVSTMHKSMKSYTQHVLKAHNNVIESFVFPLYINGLTT